MTRYPYSIDNGYGEQLTFLGITHGPHGERAEAEGIAQLGAGPPMHVHYLQEEGARVVTGRLGYQDLARKRSSQTKAKPLSGPPERRTSGGTQARPSCA